MPLAVAFKIVSLLPALLFPACIWLAARWLGMPPLAPAVAAALGLAFLLQEDNHVWGGNLASMLAGEFAQALGICLALLYLGRLGRWVNGGRGLAGCAGLIWLMGLAHAYALLFSLLAGLFYVLRARPWPGAGARLFLLYGLGFLLLAHWSIPMLAYSPYTEKFNLIWSLESWRDYFPLTLLPVILLAPLGVALARRRDSNGQVQIAGFLVFQAVTAALLHLAAPLMNTVTIRFLPFAYLALTLLAALGLGLAAQRIKAQKAFIALLLLTAALWTGQGLVQTPERLTWNNSGVEARELWPEFSRLKEFLRGDQAQPRVSYEHSQAHQRLGSTRALETLPMWTGRNTLENAYLQASPNAPFVFYLQSETCLAGSTPLPQYTYSRLDLTRPLAHFVLFNVVQFIAIEPKTRALADAQPGLILQRRYGPYSVYRVAANRDRYLEPPRFWPVLVATRRPQELAYLWFRFTDLAVPLVFVEKITDQDRARFPQLRLDSGGDQDPLLRELRDDRLPRMALDCPAPVEEKIGLQSMEASGLQPGCPLLVKASYHPAWRAASGERIYRATPAFMLVFPSESRLNLAFAWAWPHYLGLALTLLGLVLLPLAWRQPAWVGRIINLGQGGGGRPPMGRRGWLFWSGLACAAGIWFFSVHEDSGTLRDQGRRLVEAGRVDEARQVFRRGIARFPQGMVADYAIYDLALTYFRADQPGPALDLLDRLARDFPDSILLPETLHHQALCLEALGRAEEATQLRRELRERFPQ
jgi:hypothetical protein